MAAEQAPSIWCCPSVAIVISIVIVSTSYQQTIHAIPAGVILWLAQLGRSACLWLAVVVDRLHPSVAVSVSSGVMQIVSAFPALYNYRSLIAVSLVMFMMVINLRGVRESGMTFTIPIYLFVVMMVITIVVGLFRYFTGTLGTLVNPPEMIAVGAATAVTPFLLLHAFSSGTSAMTGIEAISNESPHSRNRAAAMQGSH